jgi:putative membrane protein
VGYNGTRKEDKGNEHAVQILIRWAIGAVALFLTVQLAQFVGVRGLAVKDVASAFVVVLALTLVNAFVRPVVRLMTAPLNCLTLGLFSFVVNALMFWLVGLLDIGLTVKGIVPALFGSIVMSLVGGVLNTFVPGKNEERR